MTQEYYERLIRFAAGFSLADATFADAVSKVWNIPLVELEHLPDHLITEDMKLGEVIEEMERYLNDEDNYSDNED